MSNQQKRNRCVVKSQATKKQDTQIREYIKQSYDKVQMRCDPSGPQPKTAMSLGDTHIRSQLKHQQTCNQQIQTQIIPLN